MHLHDAWLSLRRDNNPLFPPAETGMMGVYPVWGVRLFSPNGEHKTPVKEILSIEEGEGQEITSVVGSFPSPREHVVTILIPAALHRAGFVFMTFLFFCLLLQRRCSSLTLHFSSLL
mgnify:CR=1 FL=1